MSLCSIILFHIILSLVLVHFLYGISEGGAMHLVGMFIEIGFEGWHIALAHFAQHPSYSLVDEVM